MTIERRLELEARLGRARKAGCAVRVRLYEWLLGRRVAL